MARHKKKEIHAKKLKILSETEFSLAGINIPKDGTKYHRRFLQIMTDDHLRNILFLRSEIISGLHKVLDQEGFREIETKILLPKKDYSGAASFETKHKATNKKYFLRKDMSGMLIELAICGFSKIYEIGKNFRNESVRRLYNPEFTMLEYVWVNCNYSEAIKFTQKILRNLIGFINPTLLSIFPKINKFAEDIPVYSVSDLVENRLKIDKNNRQALENACRKGNLKWGKTSSRGQLLFEIYDKLIKPSLKNPVIIKDLPADTAPINARREQGVAQEFKLVLDGFTAGHGYSLINNQKEQLKVAQMSPSRLKQEIGYFDIFQFGFPQTQIVGISIERLMKYFTDCERVKDISFLPFI